MLSNEMGVIEAASANMVCRSGKGNNMRVVEVGWEKNVEEFGEFGAKGASGIILKVANEVIQ